jgi:signal transduction histidine kinase
MRHAAAGPGSRVGPLDLVVDENFHALAEAMHDFIATVTLDGQVRFINRAGRHRIGLAEAGTPPAALAAYLQADDHALVPRLVTDVISKGHEQRSHLRFIHQQTGFVVAMSCHLFRLKQPGGSDALTVAVVGRELDAPADDPAPAAHDASPQTRLSEMFAGVVGHDLRNPLNAILTCAHFVIQQTNDETMKMALQRIVSSGHRMQRMIDQLLDVTRIRAGGGIPLQVAALDLESIIQHALQETSAAYAACPFDFETHGDTRGDWDADRIAQLVSNVLGNAAQHGTRPDGVRVVLDGGADHQVVVTVHNAGAIPAEFLPVLFNPFRIVHQKRHKSTGLGLGLYISHQIALAHGGAIAVTSSPEAGTTFRIRLPRRATDPQPLGAATGLGSDDMAILELLATAPRATSVTAQLFGAAPLHERAPQEYWHLFERYARLLELALDHQTYKSDSQRLSEELRDIAEQLGRLGAGAREVAELHARALRQRTREVAVLKAQAFTAEGRLVSFELMGHLLSFYRRRSGLAGGS